MCQVLFHVQGYVVSGKSIFLKTEGELHFHVAGRVIPMCLIGGEVNI